MLHRRSVLRISMTILRSPSPWNHHDRRPPLPAQPAIRLRSAVMRNGPSVRGVMS